MNEKGAELKEVTCQPPNDKYCNYIEREGVVTRNCSAGEGLWPPKAPGCIIKKCNGFVYLIEKNLYSNFLP